MAEKVKIDQDECMGSEAFVIEGSDQDVDCVDDAIASCPAECISKE